MYNINLLAAVDNIIELNVRLTAMTKQRDDLAEALKEIEWSNNSQWQTNRAKEALQSIN